MSDNRINLAGTMTDIDSYAVWRPKLPDRDVVQLCLGDGHVLMEMSPATAYKIGLDLVAHGEPPKEQLI